MPAVIEIRLARETPSPGYEYARLLSSTDGYYVEDRPLICDAGVEKAEAFIRQGGLVLDVYLKAAAASHLAEAAAAMPGGRLAILIESRLVAAPVIVDANSLLSRNLQIGLQLPEREATNIASAVAAKWRS